MIVGVLKQTGVFEYLAIWAAKRARGPSLQADGPARGHHGGRLRDARQRHHGAPHRPRDVPGL
ncbi:hypothetical protein [Nonomuraea dietziae]|uniref:hypothetical protein n=1 Tax=Nonomuraea dietziae TaxID=65515 RepID=UPI0031DBB2A2